MKSKINAYPLINKGQQHISMPKRAGIMTVKYNNSAGHAILYVLVETDEKAMEAREIIILSCDEIFEGKDKSYIDTFCDQRGLTFHVFEKISNT